MNSKALGVVFAVLVLAGFSAQAQHRLVTGSAKAVFAQAEQPPRVVRQRAVTLNLPAVASAMADRAPFIEIAFFNDAVFTVFLKSVETTHSGGLAYAGQAVTSPDSSVVIVDNPDAVVVLFTARGMRYSIEGTAERGYLARELITKDRPDHGPVYLPPTNPIEIPASVLGIAKEFPIYVPPPPVARDDGSTIDVAVLYTQKGRLDNGGTATMNANVDAQIALTNAVYGNSNVVQRLRLVYKGEVTHTESDMDTDLARLITVGDGFLDEAPILRDIYAADIVSLWGDYSAGNFCGLGSLMATESNAFAPRAYNVLSSPDCTGAGSFTFAHELGHNMGLRHDNYQDHTANTNVTPEAGGAAVNVTYAHGYIDLVNRFRTVMSYDDQCNAQNPSFSCTRVAFFSNPAISFNNNLSYAPAVLAPTGNAATAHERQALNDTRETTANFRQGLSSFTGPGVITFLPTNGTVAEGGGSIVLNVGRHLGSTGAVSVSYTTVSGTATAGADFTTTSGTLSWTPGDTSNKTIPIPILQDATLEGTETFTVVLSVPTGGATIATGGGTATVRILDDEPDTFPTALTLPAGFTTPNVPNANTPDSTWTVDPNVGYLSNMSLGSAQAYSPDGTFTNFGNSDLEYTANFTAGNVTFRYKLSGYHQSLSGFEFQVDNVVVASANAGGEVDWTAVTQAITAGTHTLRWRFKNKLPFACANAIPAPPGGANCADRAWVDAVVLPAAALNPPRLANISTRMQVLTGNDVMIGGFVISGATPKTVAIVATGPSLVPFGIANALANPTLTLVRQSDQATLATNDNWGSAANAAAITSSGFAPSNPLEPAILTTLAPGAYTAIVQGVGGTGVGIVAVYEVDHPDVPLINISTRGQVLTGNDVMIGGFIIQGTGPQNVAIVATGPSLVPFGIANALANPTLTLVRQSDQAVLATNDNWGSAANAAAITASGFAPSNALESAILISLPPGAYTAILSGVGGGTGVGIIGVYKAP